MAYEYITDSNGRKFRRYNFIETTDLPVYDYRDANIDMLIKTQQPLVLKNSGLVASADRWTLDFLQRNIGSDGNNVYMSNTRKFMYYNDKKCSDYSSFVPPIEQAELTFSEFVNRFRAWKPGDKRLYYQQKLTDSVSPAMVNDFTNFHWEWLNRKMIDMEWGELTSNMLLIGQPGNITPAHFDEQQNFFAQLHGYKHVILFHPKYFRCLYPYPYHHPCDRQSQVDFDNPDFQKFPLLKHARGMEAVVGPGDVLYIPQHWWHYIESTEDSEITTSITFWYKDTGLSLKDIKFPLNWQLKISMLRNVEKMLGEALGNPSEIGPFLNVMVKGRYEQHEEDIKFEEDN